MIKVADFGLSEDVYARKYFRQGKQGETGEAPVKLPIKWMALESLTDRVFSERRSEHENVSSVGIMKKNMMFAVVIWSYLLGGVLYREESLSWS